MLESHFHRLTTACAFLTISKDTAYPISLLHYCHIDLSNPAVKMISEEMDSKSPPLYYQHLLRIAQIHYS